MTQAKSATPTTTQATEPIAAIDIGSDTVHLLVGVPTGGVDDGRVEVLDSRGDLNELGRQVALTGSIGPSTAKALAALVKGYVARARKRTDHIVIGATEAMREAKDGPAVLERLEQAAGVPIRILTGEREAELGLIGLAHRLDATDAQLVIDSGGASTELTMTSGKTRSASASLPVGAALLGASLVGDPPGALSWALGGSRIGMTLAAAPTGTPTRAVATGGSAHNLAGLERTKGRSGPQVLTLADLRTQAAELLSKPAAKIAKRTGEDPRRVAILPPGLLIVASVLAHYGLDRVTVVPEGLREGMVIAAATLGDDWWQGAPAATTPAAAPKASAPRLPRPRSPRKVRA